MEGERERERRATKVREKRKKERNFVEHRQKEAEQSRSGTLREESQEKRGENDSVAR